MPDKPLPTPLFSRFALEVLSREHDRAGFTSGLESVDRYLRETARGHLEKGVSVTRVLVEKTGVSPKQIAGYFTLTVCEAVAGAWPLAPKGLPNRPVPVVLLGRLAVAQSAQGKGLGAALVEAAIAIAAEAVALVGGAGLMVDAANEEVIRFYEKFGFVRTLPDAMRLFLPAASLTKRR